MCHPVDLHVGTRLRQQRRARGLSQTELGGRLGISFQQLQKYETGRNRISASRLWELADVLGVPVTCFFEGLGPEEIGTADHERVLVDGESADFLRTLSSLPGHRQQQLRRLVLAVARMHLQKGASESANG